MTETILRNFYPIVRDNEILRRGREEGTLEKKNSNSSECAMIY